MSELTKMMERALNETKRGKALGEDVITQMPKNEGVTVVEWLVRVFNVFFLY